MFVLCLALLLLFVSNLYLYAQLFLSVIIILNVFTAYIFFSVSPLVPSRLAFTVP